jgi:hypothetical protein
MEIVMAEITQPTPVKPIWPTRQERHPLKRNAPKQSEEGDRKNRKNRDDGDAAKPVIDEYV